MNTTTQHKMAGRDDIALLAYQKWEAQGRPSGKEMEFWLEAEQQLVLSDKTKAKAAEHRLPPVGNHPKASRPPGDVVLR
jgi:hypothetical protein